MEGKNMQIRNSTVDFMVFTKDAGSDSIEVRVQDGDVWLTKKPYLCYLMWIELWVTKHLKNIFETGELEEDSVCAKFCTYCR